MQRIAGSSSGLITIVVLTLFVTCNISGGRYTQFIQIETTPPHPQYAACDKYLLRPYWGPPVWAQQIYIACSVFRDFCCLKKR